MPYKLNPFTGELNLVSSPSNAALKIDTDSGTADLLHISGGRNISTSGSNATVTISLDPDIIANAFSTADTAQGLTVSQNEIRAHGANPDIPISIAAKGSSSVVLGPTVSIGDLHIKGNTLSPTEDNNSIHISYGKKNALMGFGESGSITNLGPLTDGQLMIGSSDNPPVIASLTAGNGIAITSGPGSITLASTVPNGNVVGPSSAVDDNFCAFDSTTGALIKDSGISRNTLLKTEKNLSDVQDKEEARSNLGIKIGRNVQAWSDRLDSIASMNNGIAVRTSTHEFTSRKLKAPYAGITIDNSDGILGEPTFALANDLAAVERLSGKGFAIRTGKDKWINRSLVAGSGINIENSDGVQGNPIISLQSPMVLVQSQNAKNSPSIVFSSGLLYRNYMLLMSGVKNATDNCFLQMLISKDGGNSYITKGYDTCTKTHAIAQGPSWDTACPAKAESLLLSGEMVKGFPAHNLSYSGSLHIFNVGIPELFMIRGQCIYKGSMNIWHQGDISGCGDSSANAFCIKMSSGNIKSGRFTLYGFNEG